MITPCPACNKPMIPWQEIKDFSITSENFWIIKCPQCGLMKTLLPEGTDLNKYYDSPNYISHNQTARTLFERIYMIVRNRALKNKSKLLESLKSPSRNLMDIGCGTGQFLKFMAAQGWTISGIEKSSMARALAEKNTKTTIGNDPNGLNGSYGIITLWHVLEHLEDPVHSIKNFLDHIDDGGFLVIAVPNYKSADGIKYGIHWAGLDVPRHLWHFTSASMISLADRSGLKIARIVPMKYDAYYVSI